MDVIVWSVVALSLKVALVATVASLPLALVVAVVLSRLRFPGHALLNVAVHLPLILPPVVTGYFLLVLFGRRGPIGAWLADIGIVFAFNWTGAALAAAVMAFPLMVRSIRLAVDAVDVRVEAASRNLGAGPAATFAFVTLPLIAPGILAGMVVAFAKALGEFGATITFVSNIPGETRTLPLAIYTELQVPGGEERALVLVAISVGISVVALLGSEILATRTARWVGGQ
ncbi:molybdate ABC transporter permease subunit [Acuticoccus sediminis]|uniref:Molybdenum transport system permease n=1 Tax=Acuticoccus sediminis TaxID=2184697 RepID=A0A8B2NYC3_9HYPH|nr:molybdate ABC transporter permease subunit [Acuticoccus sediminis]RAI04373.1 molybdate ABC transporter permease subunit [Acuticoccus sediminis]